MCVNHRPYFKLFSKILWRNCIAFLSKEPEEVYFRVLGHVTAVLLWVDFSHAVQQFWLARLTVRGTAFKAHSRFLGLETNHTFCLFSYSRRSCAPVKTQAAPSVIPGGARALLPRTNTITTDRGRLALGVMGNVFSTNVWKWISGQISHFVAMLTLSVIRRFLVWI